MAVVTGASRGIGKGVAIALGAAGATVYVTGRSSRGAAGTIGSIEETADAVTAAGGKGVAIRCDHGDDEQVKAVFARVAGECGRLDLLVNNATYLPRALVEQGAFWERSIELADMYDVGLRSTYVASFYAAALMSSQHSGLIANISFYGAVSYFHGPAYGSQKAAIDKMSHDMAVDLAPHNVAALAIWPGFVRTEAVLNRWQGTPEGDARISRYETPQFTGLVIDALLHDADLMQLSGQAIIAAEYARNKGIRDLNGKQPPSYRDTLGAPRRFFQNHRAREEFRPVEDAAQQ